MERTSSSSWACIGLVVFGFLWSPRAFALPALGAERPKVAFEDADGRRYALEAFADKPILVLYEDKESSRQNLALKNDLSELARAATYKDAIALVAVADVSRYDYWPARGLVRSAIRSESDKFGTTIYCDWTGEFRRAVQLTRDVSSVVLIDRTGRVIFAQEGPLAPVERKKLLRLLRSQLRA